MKKVILNSVFWLLIATAAPGKAQENVSPEGIPSGTWRGSCDAWGVPAICTSQWRTGLHDNHWIQSYSIVRQADEVVLFSGRGVYRLDSTKVDGFWEDSGGAIHPLAGTYQDNSLSVIWGSADTEIGRSVYTFQNGAMTARDYSLTDTGWRQFMEIHYPPDSVDSQR
jgi:hypothetical protein